MYTRLRSTRSSTREVWNRRRAIFRIRLLDLHQQKACGRTPPSLLEQSPSSKVHPAMHRYARAKKTCMLTYPSRNQHTATQTDLLQGDLEMHATGLDALHRARRRRRQDATGCTPSITSTPAVRIVLRASSSRPDLCGFFADQRRTSALARSRAGAPTPGAGAASFNHATPRFHPAQAQSDFDLEPSTPHAWTWDPK